MISPLSPRHTRFQRQRYAQRRPPTALVLFLALAGLTSLFLQHVPAQATSARDTHTGYWHTSGTQILDSAGQPVHMAGVTWYGMGTSNWVPAGLDFQRYTTIMDLAKLLGYNTIRLPFSNELVERNPVVTTGVAANPELRGKRALEVMDDIVDYARRIGLKIVLDNHRSRAARPMEINSLYPPLWYTRQYPESSWIHDWETLARRYRGNDAVIGFDLRNEPHVAGSSSWTLQTYLRYGPTWGPYHGVENPATDWRLAAQRAGNAVLTINPHLLIFVQGLQLYPDRREPNGVAVSWWAGILTQVKRYPITLNVPHQLVYSVHEWGPRKHEMPWFRNMTYRSLQAAWHDKWSFLLDHPDAPYTAPVWLGEFGTCTESQCLDPRQPGSQGRWFLLLLRFLHEHPSVAWSFYALNGTNANECLTDNGVLNAAWNNVSSLKLQAGLRSAQEIPGLLPTTTKGPILPGTVTQRRPRSPRSPLCQLP